MSFKNLKKGFVKTFLLFFAVASCLGFIGRAQAGTNEARTYFQIHMPDLITTSPNFQCLQNGSLNRMIIVELTFGFEQILTEYTNGVDGNTLSSDWANTVLRIIANYSCLLNSPNPSQDLNRVGNMALLMLMAGGNTAGAGSTSSPSQPLQVSPTSLNFGSILMSPNILQVAQMVTVTNVSNLPLSFFYTSNSNPDFVVDTQQQTCNTQTPLTQGQSCSIFMSFYPSQPGPKNDSLTIAFSDTNARTYSVLVPLSGKGVAVAPPPAPVAQCGNGTVETGEECDDGNSVNGDGCSSTCAKEVITSSQSPVPAQDPSAAAGGGCSMGAASSAQATSLLSLLPFGLVALARVSRKK